jgi:hypothetical protein
VALLNSEVELIATVKGEMSLFLFRFLDGRKN